MHSKRYAFFYGSQAKRYLDRIITLLVYVLFFPVIALILFLPLGYLVNEYQEGSVDMIVRILIYAFLVFLSALFMASVVSALLPQYTVVTDHSVLIKRCITISNVAPVILSPYSKYQVFDRPRLGDANMHLFRLLYMHGNIWSRSMQMSKYIMFRWKMFVHLLMMSMRAASFRKEQRTIPCPKTGCCPCTHEADPLYYTIET